MGFQLLTFNGPCCGGPVKFSQQKMTEHIYRETLTLSDRRLNIADTRANADNYLTCAGVPLLTSWYKSGFVEMLSLGNQLNVLLLRVSSYVRPECQSFGTPMGQGFPVGGYQPVTTLSAICKVVSFLCWYSLGLHL